MENLEIVSSLKLYDIESAEAFFKTAVLPDGCIVIEEGVKVINLKKFVDSHLTVIRNNMDKAIFKPYYERLIKLAAILKRNNPADILPPVREVIVKASVYKKPAPATKSTKKKK